MKKILVVEDEYMLQMMIEKMIEKMGHEVAATVKSGLAAVEKVRETEPDIILMDIKIIGDYDGIETVQKIREFSDVPVLYLTGNTNNSTMERARLTEPMFFVSKPFQYNDLKAVVDEALGLKAS